MGCSGQPIRNSLMHTRMYGQFKVLGATTKNGSHELIRKIVEQVDEMGLRPSEAGGYCIDQNSHQLGICDQRAF